MLHDWDDERALSILGQCHRAMAEGARLLVAEMVIAPGNDPFLGKLLDVHLLVVGGQERTEPEFRALFERAGFRLSRIIPTSSPMRIVEGLRL